MSAPAPMPLQPSGSWRISRRGVAPIVLLASLGLITTWALEQEVSRLESERVATAFAAAARDRILVLQRELQSSLNIVQDIGSFFDANPVMRRGQFREFVQPVLKRDPSIQALQWVPRVEPRDLEAFLQQARMTFPRFSVYAPAGTEPTNTRETPYFPLMFAHPYASGITPLGVDLAADADESAAIRATSTERRMHITHRQVAAPDAAETSLLNVYLAVFEREHSDAENDDPDVGPDRDGPTPTPHLRGVAIGRFRMDEIVHRALSNLSPSGIDIAIRFDKPAADTPPTLHTHFSRMRGSTDPVETTSSGVRTLTDTIEIAGYRWIIECRGIPGIFRTGAWSSRFVFAGGLAFTLLLAAYLFTLIGRAEKVEKLVSQRTLELEHSNQALNRQIAERLRAEKALQGLNATLEQRVAQRAVEAERRAGELEQFAYVAAHDLKAPLRGVSNLAQWLAEDLQDKLTEDSREQLVLMRDRVRRMHGLIEGLLSYSRIGRVEERIEPVDCRQLVAEVVDSITPPPGFRIDVAADLPMIHTDRLQLGQVFANLISNSIKHHHRDTGRVSISSEQREGMCEFTVTDDGPGIPAEYHEKVFMMFQTLQVKDTGGDTGIGLALVKKIVEEHGGSIRLKSAPGEGTQMRFTWAPQKPPETDAAQSPT